MGVCCTPDKERNVGEVVEGSQGGVVNEGGRLGGERRGRGSEGFREAMIRSAALAAQ